MTNSSQTPNLGSEVDESVRNSKMERLKQFYGDEDGSVAEVREFSSYEKT